MSIPESGPEMSISTADVAPTTAVEPAPPAAPPAGATPTLPYAPEGPRGADAVAPAPAANRQSQPDKADPAVDEEQTIWEGRYSFKNFFIRLTTMTVLTVAWIVLWFWSHDGTDRGGWSTLAVIAGILLGLVWLGLIRRIVMARFGHKYRLTDRRVFVGTGVFTRRRDQMELIKAKDVFTNQTFSQRFLGVGTVVVVSSEAHFPIMYLTGVNEPKAVMDLVWKHARSERDNRAVHVDQV